jgi:hypothetical protein
MRRGKYEGTTRVSQRERKERRKRTYFFGARERDIQKEEGEISKTTNSSHRKIKNLKTFSSKKQKKTETEQSRGDIFCLR